MSLTEILGILEGGAEQSTMNRYDNMANMQLMMQAAASAQTRVAVERSKGKHGKGGPIVAGASGDGGGGGNFRPTKGAFAMPVKGLDLSELAGDFGPRVHPVHGGYSNHTGADIGRASGTPIYAIANGRVGKAGWDSIYGNQVIIRHGHGLATMYGHNSKLSVKKGDTVRKGQVIGFIGSTGLSTGPHSHWEVWRKGNPVDPYKWLRAHRGKR